MASDKTVYARVTNSNGTFLANWFNIDFRGYEKTLNGGVGECVIDYAVPFDYDGSDLREGNDVELILRDKDTVEGSDDPGGTRLIYKGYISLIERVLNPGDERVIVHILGYYTLLALDILRSSSNTTLYSNPGGLAIASVDLEASDIGQIAQAVLNTFNIHSNPGKLFWTDESIPTLATEAAYTFVQKTYREALDILKAMAPPNTYWYADETGKVSFKPAPTEPTHTFIAKRHVATLRVEKSLEKVRNVLAIWNGSNGPSVYKSFSDDASIAQYGRRAERINDFGINGDDADDAMAAYAAKFLAENKDPSIKIVATIIDNNSGISAPGDALVPRLEANLVSNSGFENDDDWTVGAGWSNSGGREHFTVGATGRVIGDQASKSVVGETGYVVNDVLTLVGGDNNAQIRVTAVDGFGAIDAWETVAIGTNYLANSFCSTTGGTGTGAQFYVPFVFTEPLSIPLNTVAGTEYRLRYEYQAGPNGQTNIHFRRGATGEVAAQSFGGEQNSGTHEQDFDADADDEVLYIYGQAGPFPDLPPWTGSIDNVRVNPVTFVPYVQATGTDIEDIHPGDTCRFLGFSSNLSDIFRDNMLITRVSYTLDSVEIEVELNKSGLLDVQARQGRAISDIGNGGLGIPESYT